MSLMLCSSFEHLAAAEIRVAVASNFYPVLSELAEQFEENSTHRISLITGSSGKLAAQIMQRAPYDLFLSADMERAKFLEENGRIVLGTRVTYARGRLVVVAQEPETDLSPLQKLSQKKFSQVSVANPSLAPYGLAASQVIKKIGLSLNKTELVQGENISQTFHFFTLGKTDLALLSLSQVLSVDMNPDLYEEIPQDYYQPIQQQMVVLNKVNDIDGSAMEFAMSFYRYLLSEEVQKKIVQLGYAP